MLRGQGDTLLAIVPEKKRKRRRTRFTTWGCAGACLVLLLLIAAPLIGYIVLNERYQRDIHLAQRGASDLQKGIALLQEVAADPFTAQAAGDAQQHFSNAQAAFSALQTDLVLLPDPLTVVTPFEARVSAARQLVPFALQAAQAGKAGSATLALIIGKMHSSSSRQDVTLADLDVLSQQVQHMSSAFHQVLPYITDARANNFAGDPGLGALLRDIRTHVPQVLHGMQQAQLLLSAAPTLLGIRGQAHYLIEVLDSSKLTPGGGVIGNYAIATLSGGRLRSAHVTDADFLDYGHQYPLPATYSWYTIPYPWGFRFSNLDVNFTTNARAAEGLYQQEKGGSQFTGVIALTPAIIARLLTLTGPLHMPEYNETVTPQNLVDRIHYHQLIEEPHLWPPVHSRDGFSSTRKHFISILGDLLLAKLQALPQSVHAKLIQVLFDAVSTRDIQVYFNPRQAEQALQNAHIADELRTDTGDSFVLEQANIGLNAANQYLVTQVNDQVTIDAAGAATHQTRIHFLWTTPATRQVNFYGRPDYESYLRVYLPRNSTVLQQPQWAARDQGSAGKYRFLGGYYTLNYPSTGTITLSWRVTNVLQKQASRWHYHYWVEHQAGAQQSIALRISHPSCPSSSSVSPDVMIDTGGNATVIHSLDRDELVDIGFTCR